MTDPTLAQRLATLAAQTTYERVPTDVRESVLQRVTDTVGLILGARTLDTSGAAIGLVLSRGGVEQSSILGERQRVPMAAAAFANGVLAHSLDYDDTHLPSILHPSSSVIPASLAVAQARGRSGAELLAAIAVGLEVCVRLGMAGYDKATNRNVYFEHGQHATSICGTIAASVSAAMLLGLDAPRITDTVGVSVSMASGVIEANRGGGSVKRMHCGWAAQAGVTAAELVAVGFTGPASSLEGRFGFFEAYTRGEVDHHAITDGLGETWAVPGIFFKPYPANHFTHTIVDAAARLAATGVGPEQIAEITVGVPTQIVRTVGEPIESKRRPETAYQTQFSGPYAVTIGLFGGHGLGAGLSDYSDALAVDPARRALMARVRVEADEQCDSIYPHQFPCVLTATLRDGTVRRTEALVNRGGPAYPLSADELATKFTENATRSLSTVAAARVLAAIGALPTVDAIGAIATASLDERI